jgi:glycerate kinase
MRPVRRGGEAPGGHLVAAPDKFRGTASAPDAAAAAGRAARAAGWTADEVPMADGGEGLLAAAGGEERRVTVTGPLGRPVAARYGWRDRDARGRGPVAVVETAEACGRALVPHPGGDDPVRASTAGVGQLLLAAAEAGARRIVIGCGGSATTDGGLGAVEAVGGPAPLAGVELTVACDVTTPFLDAATVFGPQKGATPEQVVLLSERLVAVAARYRRDFGVDVDGLPGAGAAGGLAGGLAALGARLVPGFDLVADLVGLAGRLEGADLVVTGEGQLDPPSFQGKVVGGVLGLVAGRCPVLCVVGRATPEALVAAPPGLEVADLSELAGPEAARTETVALIEEVVARRLARGPGPG